MKENLKDYGEVLGDKVWGIRGQLQIPTMN